MSNYKYRQKISIDNPSADSIENKYDQGFVFVRPKNEMHQVRSLRVDVENFSPSSENRRILRKTQDFQINIEPLPLKKYHWTIHKTGADFYQQRFGDSIFSANKIKQLITQPEKSNFNSIVICQDQKTSQDIGWCISYQAQNIFHYAYPFYNLIYFRQNLGASLILKTILTLQKNKLKYLYLGSIWNKQAKYKLQFQPAQFFDGQQWQDTRQLKL